MPVALDSFVGTIPALHPRLLPPNAATLADAVLLDRGSLRPLRVPALAHTLASAAQSIHRHAGAWFGFDAITHAVPGPVANDRLYVTGDGAPKFRVGGAWRPLALPAPVAVPSVTPAGHPPADDDLAESTLYAYTWVTDLGEESQPSPLSGAFQMTAGEGATIGGFDTAFPTGRGVIAYRIYRSVTGLTGSTTLYFVAEHPINTGSYVHNPAANPINEAIVTADYDPPPAGLSGLISMPNGMMAAFTGREICFSEPFLPHAWPIKYRLKVEYPIVGLAAFGTMLAILTTGMPYRAEGTHPEIMQMEKIEQVLPCVSARSIVDLGYAAAYASTNGVALITADGARNVTNGLLTLDQWDAMNPAGFVAQDWNGLYVVSHQPVGAAARQLALFDFRGQVPYLTSAALDADDLALDVTTGDLYALVGGTEIWQFHGGTADELCTWRSKLYDLPFPANYGVVMVDGEQSEGDDPQFEVRVYADRALRFVGTRLSEPMRLPGDFLARDWEIELFGNAHVRRVVLAETMTQLAG